jgi:hypothetical protein
VRRLYLFLIAAGLVVFLAVSAMLARVWSAQGAESAAIITLVKDEAHGDQAGVIAQITGCRGDAVCRARAAVNVAALRRPGAVLIITLQPSTGFSLVGSTGIARVAWLVGSSLPIVQCVLVRRAGNAISGLRVRLLRVSLRIHPSNRPCPARF